MAKKNRMGLRVEGIEEILKRLDEVGGNLEETTEEALKKSHKFATGEMAGAMLKHNKTYRTINSLEKEQHITWQGSKAMIDVGFDIANGGLPSIFLMYGTPRIKKDTKLYSAVYGKKTLERIAEIQADVFFEAIAKAGGR